jgi:hypothetical protein
VLRNRLRSGALWAKPAQNEGGSTDLYLHGSTPRQGRQLGRDSAGKRYVAVIRLYGPIEAAFDRSRKPGDMKAVKVTFGCQCPPGADLTTLANQVIEKS